MEHKQPIRTKITYDFYSDTGRLIYRNTYEPEDHKDYDRIMKLFNDEPTKYQFVSAEYGYEWRKGKST